MSRLQLGVFIGCLILVIVIVGASVGCYVGLEQAFTAALTAALVYVTAAYAFFTLQIVKTSEKQARIMGEQQVNIAAPVITLKADRHIQIVEEFSEQALKKYLEVERIYIKVAYMNIGKGPALNFRCWIEDPEYPELRALSKAICQTAIEVTLTGSPYEGIIKTEISNYCLGTAYIRAQYESIFGITYESCLFFPTNAAPELKYGKAKAGDIVIL
jgi:hypothetical protein